MLLSLLCVRPFTFIRLRRNVPGITPGVWLLWPQFIPLFLSGTNFLGSPKHERRRRLPDHTGDYSEVRCVSDLIVAALFARTDQ